MITKKETKSLCIILLENKAKFFEPNVQLHLLVTVIFVPQRSCKGLRR